MELHWTSIFVGLAGEKHGQDELIKSYTGNSDLQIRNFDN